MWYTIKEGRHRAYPLNLGIHFSKDYQIYEIMFTDSCKYDLGDIDNLDWNKGGGWSYGLHHKNSIRWVWRYNKTTDKFEISLYNYIDSELQVREDFLEVESNLKWNLTLFNLKDWNMSGIYISRIDRVSQILTGDYIKPKWGYILNPNFGGNETQPNKQDMDLWIKKN